MNIRLKIFISCISLLLSTICYSQIWTQITDFPSTERDDGTVFTIGDTAYCGTGLTPWWAPLGDFHKFNLNNETFQSTSPLPIGKERQYATGFSANSKGYIFGGFDGTNYLNDLWQFDPINNTWTALTSLPDLGRSGMVSMVLGDTAYFIGGKTTIENALNEVWAYQINEDIWVQKNNLPFGKRWRSASTTLNGIGYFGFGRDEIDQNQNDFYQYTPETDSWITLSNFPDVGRSYNALTSFNSKIYMLFGTNDLNEKYKDIWEYNPLINAWQFISNLLSAGRRGGMCFSGINGIYYTTGLNDVERLKETWRFNPAVSLHELNNSNFKIYPNPADNILYIEGGNDEKVITIRNTIGQVFFVSHTGNSIDISNINSGIYFIEVKRNGMIFKEKLVIVH